MSEAFPARLTGTPPHLHRRRPSTPGNDVPHQQPAPITILPFPFPPTQPAQTQPIQQPQPQPAPIPQPIPIQLPNIYVNPYPPLPHGHSHPPPPPPPTAVPGLDRSVSAPPLPIPRSMSQPEPERGVPLIRTLRGPPEKWWARKPHPLLWVTLAISLVALVMQVPKGSLPTLTGRHRALRAQEILVQERLALLTQLSTFLPPPLSALVFPDTETSGPHLSAVERQRLDSLRLTTGLRFWAATGGATAGAGGGSGGEGAWWSVEELGEGASVVRSKGGAKEREVWVLRTDAGKDGGSETGPLLQSLTHSLLLRDRLQTELDDCRSTPCPSCPPILPVSVPTLLHPYRGPRVDLLEAGEGRDARDGKDDDDDWREEWERLENRRRKERERENEVEERERDVSRREKWVVEEMRKLSDKVHAQATELTLEDRITERLKAYQRQLVHLGHGDETA